jgi:hypothetical protein
MRQAKSDAISGQGVSRYYVGDVTRHLSGQYAGQVL